MPVSDADSVYREHVYCYELYHQLRRLWRNFQYTLAGEVDKAGHPFFSEGPYSRAKPDFLVHCAGQMGCNLVVVEAKPATASLSGLKEDLDKLSWFCENAHYKAGLLLIYGDRDIAGSASGELEAHRAQLASHEKLVILIHPTIGANTVRALHPNRLGAV